MIEFLLDFIKKGIGILIHLDEYLLQFVDAYGIWVYVLLFLIIFCETGLVLTPFLPGDSLLFVLGTLAAQDTLNIWILLVLLIAAAIIGDTVNYWFGNKFGEQVFIKSKLFNEEYLHKTQEFYKEHGGKTIIIARFVPIVRTFAPFVAGIGKMDYKRFLTFNIIGAVIWVSFFLFAGYFFGGIQWVQDNLIIVILLISITSLIPPIIDFVRHQVPKGMHEISKVHAHVSGEIHKNMVAVHGNIKKVQKDVHTNITKMHKNMKNQMHKNNNIVKKKRNLYNKTKK